MWTQRYRRITRIVRKATCSGGHLVSVSSSSFRLLIALVLFWSAWGLAHKRAVKAVHEHDLRNLLESLGMLTLVEGGNANCAICEKHLTLEDIGCIFPRSGGIEFCCGSLDCYEKVLVRGGDEDD